MTVQPILRTQPCDGSILRRGSEVISIEARALSVLAQALDASFVDACNAILAAPGRVVVTGMGKSGHIGRKWAATLAATGTPAIYVHPAEAAHGDLGMLVAGDVLVVISNSGNTSELRAFLRYASTIRVKVIGVASKRESLVIERADIKLCLPAAREACPANIAPTTSTTMQLALGDALAMALMDMRGFSRDDMKVLHPGGSLGLRLTPVSEIMHGPSKLPLVSQSAEMRDVIITMTSTGFGIAGVVNATGRLIGVITDGDIRRHFDDLPTATAEQVMTINPKTVSLETLAEDVLVFLNENAITSVFVLDSDASINPGNPVGIVHVHDFLRLGLG
ncbi:KpsF/GutQ family sugar-phosphate isomerase [Sphingomonas daechungensis]|uniref:KpsF/GutQ family sugar-phosphate isomerase n=1 Tax=Sphingomonas daechungensis TaxID=1176646 RepID=UPI001CB8BB74|nr:KpsF/GutQ family sugar-phosphate isomerase [Sphingomonas daechungensis]